MSYISKILSKCHIKHFTVSCNLFYCQFSNHKANAWNFNVNTEEEKNSKNDTKKKRERNDTYTLHSIGYRVSDILCAHTLAHEANVYRYNWLGNCLKRDYCMSPKPMNWIPSFWNGTFVEFLGVQVINARKYTHREKETVREIFNVFSHHCLLIEGRCYAWDEKPTKWKIKSTNARTDATSSVNTHTHTNTESIVCWMKTRNKCEQFFLVYSFLKSTIALYCIVLCMGIWIRQMMAHSHLFICVVFYFIFCFHLIQYFWNYVWRIVSTISGISKSQSTMKRN